MSVFGYSLNLLSNWWYAVPEELRNTVREAGIADGEQYENMCKYIENNASNFVAAAKRERQAVIIHPNDVLLRSIVVTPEGEFFLLLNRHSLGDKVLGKGGTKKAAIARNLNTGIKYASSRCYLMTNEDNQDYKDELFNNRVLEYAARAIPVTSSVRYTAVSANHDGTEKGRMFSLLCSDGSLDKTIERGDLTNEQRLQIMKDSASALEEVHQNGIIHRDVKPGNFLIEDGRAYIADFGTSGMPGMVGNSPHEVVLGTPAYLAPEVEFGKEETLPNQNESADIFALGVSFLELYGKAVYKDIDPLKDRDLYYQGISQAANDLGDAPEFRLIQRMVAINPEERISSSELVAAMENL